MCMRFYKELDGKIVVSNSDIEVFDNNSVLVDILSLENDKEKTLDLISKAESELNSYLASVRSKKRDYLTPAFALSTFIVPADFMMGTMLLMAQSKVAHDPTSVLIISNLVLASTIVGGLAGVIKLNREKRDVKVKFESEKSELTAKYNELEEKEKKLLNQNPELGKVLKKSR